MRWYVKTLLGTISLILVLIFFLPKPDLLEGMQFSRAIYDNNHRLLRFTLSHDDKYRLYTPISDIPETLIQAILLQEDQHFYQHFGVNPFALVRASFQTYVLKSRRMGASTITMQLARIRFGMDSRKVSGKILQIYRALQLERHYSKKEILEAYLNLAPFGSNIEGVGAASLIWFNQPVKAITLPQALLLAVIPQNPTARMPPNPEIMKIRQRLYERWLKLHPQDISWQSVMNLPVSIRKLKNLPFHAPHFVNSVLSRLRNSPNPAGNVHTTLDMTLQNLAERVLKQYLERKKSTGVKNASVLLVNTSDMSIKALAGSADFFNVNISGQINGTEIKRSPGSTLKPFVYALALDQGLIHPRTVLKDVPQSFGSYNPENFDRDFMGPVTAEDALSLSRNIPAMYLASLLTFPNLYTILEKTEVTQLKAESWYGLSLTLGGAEISIQELSTLYAMLANSGLWKPLRMLNKDPIKPGRRLLSPEASFLVLEMLRKTDWNESLGTHVAWKTGTSSRYRDAWTAGVFGPYVLIVWAGNFDNSSNPSLIGRDFTAPLFFQLIHDIQRERGPFPDFHHNKKNLNLVEVDICKASGLLPTDYCLERDKTWFIPGKSPIKKDNIYREIAINEKTGLRTCHIDDNTLFIIHEFWPSDLLKIFKKAGITRKTPPPFEKGCDTLSSTGMPPNIVSPQKNLIYIARVDSADANTIPFTATTDADVKILHWFVNDGFVGKASSEKPFFWQAKPGSFTVRVVDDHGQSDVRVIHVQVER